jgi:hypothetical protein
MRNLKLIDEFDRYCPDPSLRESHELSEEEVLLIYISLMFGVSTTLPLAPPPPVHRIWPYALDSIKAQNKTNLLSVNELRSDKEIEKFDELAIKWNSGSISMEELVLELRGGDLEEWVAKFGISHTEIARLLSRLNKSWR